MSNKVLLGEDKYNEIQWAEIKDGKIRGFSGYWVVDPANSYDNNRYLENSSWSHSVTVNDIEYKTGMVISEDLEPFFSDDELKQVILSEDFYFADGLRCDECGTFHDTEQYYNLSYIITDDGTFLCKDCASVEDLLVPVNSGSDLFKAKDISGMDIASDEFEAVDTLFCDSSGFGSPREMALTKQQATDRTDALLEEHGELFAGLTGIGQFQVYVTLYKRAA
jgi:hypothetical protein